MEAGYKKGLFRSWEKRKGLLGGCKKCVKKEMGGPQAARASSTVSASTDRQSSIGPMIWANLLRARLRRDFTVPSVTPVISEISSYVLPSISRRTNTTL